ncbi:MAG: hypothetical protein Q8M16_15645 [Pirellulaceae bacterium]|nr:hypothetical protein [Pirellulaceae bacterium]
MFKPKKPVRNSYGLLYHLRFRVIGYPIKVSNRLVPSSLIQQLESVEPEQQLERRCHMLEPNRSTKLGLHHSKKQPRHSNRRASEVGWQCVLANCSIGPSGSAKDGSMDLQLHRSRRQQRPHHMKDQQRQHHCNRMMDQRLHDRCCHTMDQPERHSPCRNHYHSSD